ncbi:MAG TPA: polymer-forming cytoskeletal protein [Stellaceae bacterium]|jgi:cytoskeletal protein CcmA (bactofilin family)|nr:polymer-forming cytoskeletal protein [Stellaceae bacterium]
MANIFGTQGKPVSTPGGLSVPPKAPPSAPQAAAASPSQLDKRDLESGRQPLAAGDSAAGTLVIGRQIVLSGEVTSCNRLVVEGTIKANIKECRDIAIAEGGLFSGSAAVESADISGRFEGELTVSGRLLIRAPGLVSGTVQYKELEIERGGRITGQVSASKSA